MSAEYPDATWVPIPGFGFPTGAHGGNNPRWIVLHGTASPGATAQNIANYFAGDNQNGTHFVIGKDGAVIQMVQLHDAAYGNGGPTATELAQHAYADFWDAEIAAGVNLNTVTISIEHCKDATDNSDILTQAQQDASFKLVAWLCKTLGIPARQADASGGITGHFSINGIERVNCPGPYPWQALWQYLQGTKEGHSGMLMQHPTDGGRLDIVYLAHNGHVLHIHNNGDGMAGLFTEGSGADMGMPSQEPLIYVEASFSNNGGSINVVGVGVSGQIYGRSFNTGDGSPQNNWTPIARSFSAFPVQSAPAPGPVPMEPLAQKIATALTAAAHTLETGLA